MALPAGFGTAAHPHLLVQTGKDGRVYLLDRDNLGGNAQGAGRQRRVRRPAGRAVQRASGDTRRSGAATAATCTRSRTRASCARSSTASTAPACPSSASAGTSASTFGYTSGSPVVTSTGTTSGSAIVWAVYSDGSNGANGQLRAYDALPVNGRLNLRYSRADRHRDEVRHARHRRRPGLRRHPRRPRHRLRPADHGGADQQPPPTSAASRSAAPRTPPSRSPRPAP